MNENQRTNNANLILLSLLTFTLSALAVPERVGPDDKAIESASQAMKAFQIPAGMKIELFAAEPMLGNPVSICLDEQNRVYVAETYRFEHGVGDNRKHGYWLLDDLAAQKVEDRLAYYKKWTENGKKKWGWFTNQVDQVRLIVDEDGDGKADRSTIFAGGFNDPLDGLAAGLIARDGDVYLTSIPHLWLLKDKDGDGEAEVRKSLHYGFGVRTTLLGHDLHGLVWGPDGKLYFSIGDRGYHVETKEGNVFHNPGSGGVFRCDPDGSNLEEFARGLRNPQELAFDQYGNLWTGDNNSDAGDRARLVYILEGGETGWHMSYQTLGGSYSRGPWHMDKIWHTQHEGQPAWIIPPIAHIGGGPSGLAYYPGTGLDPKYDHHFFMCDFHGGPGNSRIESWTVKPKGAGFEIANDHTFVNKLLATDVTFGYDGKIYISDWINGWGGTKRGRIHTLYDPKHISDPAVLETKKIFAEGFKKRTMPQLATLLEHPNMSVRQRAQFELAGRGPKAGQSFAETIQHSKNPLARLHGVWGLGQIGTPAALQSLMPFLKTGEDELLCQVMKVWGDRKFSPGAPDLMTYLKHENLRVRYFAAMALGKLKYKDAKDALLAVLRENNDRDVFLRHGCVMGLMGTADSDELAALADDPSPSVRMAALLGLRRHKDPRISVFLHDAEDRLVTEAARAINDLPIPQAMPDLAARLGRPGVHESFMRRAINANFREGSAAGIRRLATFASDSKNPERIRLEAIAALHDWVRPAPRDRVLGYYRPLEPRDEKIIQTELQVALPAMLARVKGKVSAQATKLASKYKIAMDDATFLKWVGDASRSAETRVEALRLLAARKNNQLASVLETALASDAPTLRMEGRRILAGIDQEKAIDTLSGAIKKGTLEEKQSALSVLGTMKVKRATDIIERGMAGMNEGKLDAALQLDVLKAAKDQGLADAVKRYESRLSKTDPLAKYRVGLEGGNPERGEFVFKNHQSGQCFRCHKVKGVGGGDTGPDLGKLGATQKREYILEALVAPNKTIAKGFEMAVLNLKNGTTVAGTVVSEKDGRIVIAPPAQASVTIKAAEVKNRTSQKVSPMPPMGEVLNADELRDLIEYLANQK